MKEQFAISNRDQPAGIGDESEHVPPFARSLPYRPGKRAMAAEDQAEREVTRGGASLQRVMDFQELGIAIALISGRKCGQSGGKAAAARHPLKAGSCGEAQRAGWITRDRECRNVEKRRMAHAQAQPGGAMRNDKMVLFVGSRFDQRLRAGRKRYRPVQIRGFDNHHIGRGLW